MSVNKRIVSYHIGRLQDKSPEVRLKAIQELALLGETEALEALQSVFKNDPDVDVRKAAQEAGRQIFVKQQEQEQKEQK